MIPACPECKSQETQYVGTERVCLSCGWRDQVHPDNEASPWPSTDDVPREG